MSETSLTWSKLDRKNFQKVSLFLYKDLTGDHAAEKFLRQGHFQSGIDLLSFRQETGKHVCIQCKHTDLTFSKLKQIVPLFLAGAFAGDTEKFILTTTANLQKPTIQTWITAQKKYLREHYAIAFDVWDRYRLEDALTSEYRLVEKYFGVAEANVHCFQPALTVPEMQPSPDFITRHIQPVTEIADTESWDFGEKDRSVLTLTALMAAPTDKKGICLIAEAYESKSSLIRQTAWELGQLDVGIVPLPLDLKLGSVLPVAQLLTDHSASWLSLSAKDLVVLIDGFDEVSAEQFDTVIAHIRYFTRNHPSVRMIHDQPLVSKSKW